jgi:hypothetical protein
MRQRSIPLLLPTLLVLGLLGAWAGTSAGQLPPPPTVSLPTVTVPSVTLPPAPPPPSLPTVTTPTPAPPTLPVEPPTPPVEASAPAPATPITPQPPPAATPASAQAGSTPSGRNSFGASSRVVSITNSPFSPSRLRPRRPDLRRARVLHWAATHEVTRAPRSTRVQASPRLPVEREAPRGRLGTTLGTLRSAADAVPPALFVLALLAVVLLFVAAMPQPLRASWAGAALVHHRGTIAIAGVGVLAAAILSAGLLL